MDEKDQVRGDRPLPPGRDGLPLLGETLPLMRNNFSYVSERVARHGPIFRARVLGRRTAFLAGPKATAIFNDEELVQRAGGMPDFVEQFFGGKSLPLLDGAAHRTRKQQALGAFSRAALSSFVAPMQETVEQALARLAAGGEFRAADEFRRLALSVIARNILSLGPGPELDTVIAGFADFTRGLGALPIPLPGTAFTRAIRARDRILTVLRGVIARHRERDFGDGLSHMLATRAADGTTISDEHAVLELHHFNIAGYLIYVIFCALCAELHRDPQVRERLGSEIDAHARTGPLTLEQLAALPYLDRVVREAKRFTPFVPLSFGKARKDFTFNGYRVPAGWAVIWSQHATNTWAQTYTDPGRFDPDRFSPERAEDRRHPCAFSPQGTGELPAGHKCAGYDYSTLFLQVFTVLLVRGYTWELPPQDLSYRYDRLPPEHHDGLRVRLTARSVPA